MSSEYSMDSLLGDLVDRMFARESLEVEFKQAQGGIPKSLWPTVSAFANTIGGWIVLGIAEDADELEVVGVPDASSKLDDFYSTLNNPQKISLRVCGPHDASIEELDGNELIVIRVPAAPLKERPVFIDDNPYGGTYIRGNTGDFRCSRSDVNRMMREASDTTADSTILHGQGLESLDPSAIRNYRQRYQNEHPASRLNALDDLEFLKAIDAYRKEPGEERAGITVAGLLLLGTSQAIRRHRGRHLIDYRSVAEVGDWDQRWDDRVLCEGNLLDAFESIYPRLTADLPAPFRLDGPVRAGQGPIHVALREALVNLLVHADYSETRASLIIRSPRGYRLHNPGMSRVPVTELGGGYDSDPRNPILVRMFRLVGLAEEAGTGMAKIFGAWRESRFFPPSISVDTERYEFRLAMLYTHLLSDEDLAWLAAFEMNFSEAEQMALLHARHEGFVDNLTLRNFVGIHPADATKVLVGLRDKGYLVMSGWARGARYEINADVLVWSDPGSIQPPSTNIEDNGQNIKVNEQSLQARREDLIAIAAPARSQPRLGAEAFDAIILDLCAVTALSIKDIENITTRSRPYIRERIADLQVRGLLRMTHPDTPRHPRQKYVTMT